ncbi:hypothetical protein AAF712_000355 [Marasmius tenuissimus]|uniref:Uncharacterized protein n=1 Tax=Marasmius tenuissimus TaxID=585030 RepID=A0ABR3AGU7_9AGAR
MPLVVGSEAEGSRLRRKRGPKVVKSDADTGRPETAEEFARRMVGRVRFIGPRPAQEGGNASHSGTEPTLANLSATSGQNNDQSGQTSSTTSKDHSPSPGNGPENVENDDDIREMERAQGNTATSQSGHEPRGQSSRNGQSGQSGFSLVDIVSRTAGSIKFASLIRNRYSEDLFFKKILDTPKDFKNFASF